jgi:two-component system response regulator VicR
MDQNQKQKIVIVEDNEPLAEIYRTRLEMLGYACYVAYDGITALYLIRTEQPQLVLLDLMVPNIAGDEILKRMRSSDWGKDIPVFIISNLSESDAPAGLRDLKIVGYVVKANLADDGLDKIVNSILRPDTGGSPGQV